MRARGALYGLAIGDALGMPTQLLSRAEIRGRWGELLPGFEPAPPGHPIAAGMPAGAVTDDTEQAVLLGRLLVAGHGAVDPRELATVLVDWERDMAARGSLDLLGPSTKRAVAAVLAGTAAADAGASAVAAAVSAGISGASTAEATTIATAAARLAADRGHWVAGADVAARIEWAAGLVAGRSRVEAAEVIYTLVGTSLATQESVPAAFAVLAAVPDVPWQACLLAASLGGDTDTIAAMAGTVTGACHGADAFPADAITMIDAQGLGLGGLAGELLALRERPPGEAR